jgi:CxxC motif-containing protein (DUF1111 family)
MMWRALLFSACCGGLAMLSTAAAGELDVVLGKALFERNWVAAPASTRATDGLGPLFNARSCVRCHAGGGRGTLQIDEQGLLSSPALVLQLSNDPVYGLQLQSNAIQGHAAEARIVVHNRLASILFADGERIALQRRDFQPIDLAYGEFHPATRISPRLAPSLRGLGLIEQISEQEILRYADPDDRDNDGISGRPQWLTPSGQSRLLGRFGWKATLPTLEAQTAQALAIDIGLSNPWHPQHRGDCSAAQMRCRRAPNGASAHFDDLELSAQMLMLIVRYLQQLAPPAANTNEHTAGAILFRRTGCAGCHRPQFSLAGSLIYPYSDLLLHDMGSGLADGLAAAAASGSEWRTAPLWGLAASVKDKASVALLHDGRARSITEAIYLHDGEARRAREKFSALSAGQRPTLLNFLENL